MSTQNVQGLRRAVHAAVFLLAVAPFGWSQEKSKRDLANEYSEQGLKAELGGQYDRAVDLYRKAQKLLPEAPRLHYRIGACLHKGGGDAKVATTELLAFVRMGGDGDELADAQERLDDLLLPKLTPEQRKHWEEACDYLEAQEELTKAALGTDGRPDITPARKARDLLVPLNRQVPKFLPVLRKLGSVYEHLKDYENAFQAYDDYLKGYEKLGYPPAGQRSIRVQRELCASRQRVIAKKLQEEEKRSLLKKHGAFTNVARSERQALSFDEHVLVITTEHTGDPRNVNGTIKTIYRCDLQHLDPNSVCYEDRSQPEARYFVYFIRFKTKDGIKKIQAEYSVNTNPVIVPPPKDLPQVALQTSNVACEESMLQVADEETAKALATALRDLIKLSTR